MTWLPSSIQVTQQEIAVGDRLVVHCWATWNGTDPVVDQNLQSIREEFQTVTFRSCDVDNPDFFATLRAWNVVNVPALALIERGRKPEVRYGVTSQPGLASLLRECSGWTLF